MTDNKTLMQQALDSLIESARLLGTTQEKISWIGYTKTDSMFEAACYEIIEAKKQTIFQAIAQTVEPATANFEVTEHHIEVLATMLHCVPTGESGLFKDLNDFCHDARAAFNKAKIAHPEPLPVLHTRKEELVWAIAQDKWNALADKGNQWNALGQDEMSLLIVRETELQLSQVIAQPATDKLLQIIAATYQIAGACDLPAYILDVLANPELATQEQIDAMLPFVQTAHSKATK